MGSCKRLTLAVRLSTAQDETAVRSVIQDTWKVGANSLSSPVCAGTYGTYANKKIWPCRKARRNIPNRPRKDVRSAILRASLQMSVRSELSVRGLVRDSGMRILSSKTVL